MLDKAFSTIDIFGIPILLNFSKSQKAKSAFGGFCSLLFFGFLIWSIYNSGYELFARQKPQIIDGTVYSTIPRPVDISLSKLPLAFVIQTTNPSFASNYCLLTYSIDGSESAPMEKCTPKHLNLDSDFENVISSYFCLPIFYEPKAVMSISVSAFCSLGNQENFNSQSPTVLMLFPRNGLTLHNYNSPLQLDFDVDLLPLVGNTTILSSWSLSHLNITTDDGWLTETEKVKEYIQVTRNINRNILSVGVTAISFTFSLAKQEIYYLRSYKRLQNVLAEVGGIASTVFTILSIIIMPYARIKFSECFVNELFEVKRKKPSTPATSSAANCKNNLDRNINQVTNRKESDKIKPIKRNKKQEMELKNQESKRTLKTENITVERESIGLSKKRKVSEGPTRSPHQGENEGLLSRRRQDDEQSHLQKPKMESQYPYRKIQTQPIESVPWHQLENSERDEKDDRENEHLNFIRLDDLMLPVGSQINFKSDDKSTPNTKEKKQVVGEQQSDLESQSKNKEDSQNHEVLEIAKPLGKEETPRGTEKKGSKFKRIKRKGGIKISLFEYCWSFVSRSAPLKEKMVILNQGIKIFDERLDIFNLLKKLRDVDKIKGLLLDKDQLYLFDRTSRPHILDRANHWYREEFLPYESYDMKSGGAGDKMISAEQRIQDKLKKSEIDRKILDLFQ